MSEVIDLSAFLAAKGGNEAKAVVVTYAGREWHARNRISALAAEMGVVDDSLRSKASFVSQFIVDEERGDFVQALLDDPDLSGAQLNALADLFATGEFGRPSEPSDS